MSSNHQISDRILPPSYCPHLSAFSANNGPKPFRFIQDCFRSKPPNGSSSISARSSIRREPPSEIPRCGTCFSSSRLYACLACAAVFCHSPSNRSHAVAHASLSPPGHEIAVDIDRAELFCCACREQVYHRDFDAAVVLSHTSAESSSSATSTVFANLRKRRWVHYKPWTPDMRESLVVTNGSSALGYEIPSDPDSGCLPCGLRGLNNLGNTCFMNSVLQALLHTPPLRNYFLSDRHNRYYCQQKSASAGSSAIVCLACNMDAMFSAVFSGDRKPYTPAKFLYSWWQHAANLASYEQQDAHEFFISMLDGIHENMDRNKCRMRSQGLGLGLFILALRVALRFRAKSQRQFWHDGVICFTSAMENAVLLTGFFLAFCDLMSCAWLVVSHQPHMIHVWISPLIWNLTKLQRQPQERTILAMVIQISTFQARIVVFQR